MRLATPRHAQSRDHLAAMIESLGVEGEGQLNLLANCHLKFSQTLKAAGQVPEALEAAERALQTLQQMDNPHPLEQASLTLHLAELQLISGDHPAAVKTLLDCRAILRSLQLSEPTSSLLLRVLNRLSHAYLASGDTAKAL